MVNNVQKENLLKTVADGIKAFNEDILSVMRLDRRLCIDDSIQINHHHIIHDNKL